MARYLVQFIERSFLVCTIGCTVLAPAADTIAPPAIGTALMVMVYVGEHYNPAVTLTVTLRGRCDWKEVPAYMIAQRAQV